MRRSSPDLFDYANRRSDTHAVRFDMRAAKVPNFSMSFAAWLKKLIRRLPDTKTARHVAAVLDTHPRSAERVIDGKTVMSAESLHNLMLSAHGDIVLEWMLENSPHPWAERARERMRLGEIMEAQIAATVREREARVEAERRISARVGR